MIGAVILSKSGALSFNIDAPFPASIIYAFPLEVSTKV